MEILKDQLAYLCKTVHALIGLSLQVSEQSTRALPNGDCVPAGLGRAF